MIPKGALVLLDDPIDRAAADKIAVMLDAYPRRKFLVRVTSGPRASRIAELLTRSQLSRLRFVWRVQ